MENNNDKIKKDPSNLSNDGNNKTNSDTNEGIEKIQKEVKISREIFGATGSEDINKNLGVFTNKTPSSNLSTTPNTKEDQINFQRFENTTKRKKKTYSNNKFLENFSLFLRNKKGFWTIVSLEIIFLSIIITTSILLIVSTQSTIFGFNGDGPLNDEFLRKLGHVGYIFSIIALCPLTIPLIYLITSWFVGINQVMSSRNFHLVVVFITLFCFLCLIVAVTCCAIPLIDNLNFIH